MVQNLMLEHTEYLDETRYCWVKRAASEINDPELLSLSDKPSWNWKLKKIEDSISHEFHEYFGTLSTNSVH